MPTNTLQAESAHENQKSAHNGLQQLQDWRNSLGHRPFFCAPFDDGNIPLTQAHGMVEILATFFSAGRDGHPDQDITNISDATVAAALDGVSTLISLSCLEAESFEYAKNLKTGGKA